MQEFEIIVLGCDFLRLPLRIKIRALRSVRSLTCREKEKSDLSLNCKTIGLNFHSFRLKIFVLIYERYDPIYYKTDTKTL